MTEKELDAIIAEKVMGWRRWNEITEPPDGWWADTKGKRVEVSAWSPSTNIAQAFEAAEKVALFRNCRSLCERGIGVWNGGTWTRSDPGWEWAIEQHLDQSGEPDIVATGRTPAEAICHGILEIYRECS